MRSIVCGDCNALRRVDAECSATEECRERNRRWREASRLSSATWLSETAVSGVRVPGNDFHPLHGQMVTATYTKIYSGWLAGDGPPRLVDADGGLVCFVDGERWTIEPLPFEEPTEFGATVQTDDGPAVRVSTHPNQWWRWLINEDETRQKWTELRNPRPYKAGEPK
jgi:hypothetical protein